MTPWHYRWLCQFAGIDLPDDLTGRGVTLFSLAQELDARDERGALPCGRLAAGEKEALRVIRETKELGGLRLWDYVNRNSGSGLVAYALREEEGGAVCIFRGSERPGCGVPSGVDWLDNFLAPFRGSVQYEEIRALAGRYAQERTVFTGHSKGAHNALYALAVSPDEQASAVAFNGQGFAPGQLTAGQREKLAGRGVNYVTRGDVVGVLMWHPEKRVFVQRQGDAPAHSLESFRFDGAGEPAPAMRTLWSVAVEWGTKRYLMSAQRRGLLSGDCAN